MKDLYRDVVLERYRRPHHRHPLENATAEAHTHNPLCGDELTLFVRVAGAMLVEAAFEARGCSISQASADLMIDAIQGRSLKEVDTLADAFRGLFNENESNASSELGEAEVLREVRRYPVRIKCALLAWDALREALTEPRASEPADG